MEGINLIHGDSLQALKGYDDNHFDIAIVDPPYGIGASEMTMGSGKNKKYKKGKKWDNETPNKEYFTELQRVSKNQIIWGGNYFTDKLEPTRCYIFWDKGINGDCDFADGELAWCSFDRVLRKAPIRYRGFLGADNVRIHPTQKPVKLYNWILENYTNENDLILDTHLGSGSIAIACHYMKRNLIGYEIDKEYYDAACKRFKEQTMQKALW